MPAWTVYTNGQTTHTGITYSSSPADRRQAYGATNPPAAAAAAAAMNPHAAAASSVSSSAGAPLPRVHFSSTTPTMRSAASSPALSGLGGGGAGVGVGAGMGMPPPHGGVAAASATPTLHASGPFKRSASTSSMHSHSSSVNLMHAQDEELYSELQERGPLTIRRLQAALAEAGMHPADPRLKQVHARLLSNPSDTLTFENFKYVIESASLLIYRALMRRLVVPDWAKFVKEIDAIYRDCAANNKGHVASYIPQLAEADPNTWAMAFCSIDGQQHGAGDISLPFSVQSTSKPLSYLMALEELGEEEVHRFVGREPSGRNFNELCLNSQNIPHNPMINAGAIMVASLIRHGASQADRFAHVLHYWKKLTGYSRDISFSNTVYLSEKSTANRNFCLAYLMQERAAFQQGNSRTKPPRVWKDTDLAANLDLYFQCCSVEATTQAMSVVAATLANGGICPLTGERVFAADNVNHCLALMLSCGMYDYSGEWGFVVGLPAKSGVSGIILLVIPEFGGLALLSPRLDELGNSARGIEFSKKLAVKFGLHFLNFTNQKDKDAAAAAAAAAAGTAGRTRSGSGSFASPAPSPAASPSHAPSSSGGGGGGGGYDSAPLILKAGVGAGAGVGSRHHDLSIAFIFACAQGDLGLVRALMASAVDMNAADYDGRTGLHLAASNGHLDVVAMLVRKGVDLNPVDRLGGTPLADAIREGRLDVVNFLRSQHAQLAELIDDGLGEEEAEEEEEEVDDGGDGDGDGDSGGDSPDGFDLDAQQDEDTVYADTDADGADERHHQQGLPGRHLNGADGVVIAAGPVTPEHEFARLGVDRA